MEIINLSHNEHPVIGQYVHGYVSNDGSTLYLNVPDCKIMLSDAADLNNLPDSLAPGTKAYLADDSGKWRKGADGTWETLVDPASNIQAQDADAQEQNEP